MPMQNAPHALRIERLAQPLYKGPVHSENLFVEADEGHNGGTILATTLIVANHEVLICESCRKWNLRAAA